MNVSSTSYSSELLQQMQQMQQTQRKEPPSATELTTQVFENSDSNEDGLLSIDELGLDEETFSSMDSDGDGSLSSSKIETSISSQLESMKNQTSSPQQFGDFLTSLGLEVPPPPGMQGVQNIASDIFSSKDSDEDGLLTLEELGIDEELFNTIDSDGDGRVNQEELAQTLQTMFEDLKNGDIEPSEFEEMMSALGVEAPTAAGGAGGRVPMGGGGSSEEEYEEADTNQDGTVSAAEYAAYYGSASEEDLEKYTLDLVSTLITAMKEESNANGEDSDLELSSFKDIMKMVNNQIQDPTIASELNEFVSNLDLGRKSA